jgi:glucosamine--fructose-6-phosphate aminotransferase (isomerizing)
MPSLGMSMESEISQIPEVFQTILDNSNQFDKLHDVFTKHDFNSVQILGRGTSDNAAHFLKYLIETKIGLPVGLTSLSSVTIYDTQLKFDNTLVIAISQSGQSSDLIKFSKAAKAGGGFLIAMTNDELSPLAKSADLHLSLLAGKENAVAATKSYAAELLCSLILVDGWLNQKTTTNSIVAQAKLLVSDKNLVASAVDSVNPQNEIVVLGRGFSYPNAKEFALKIQETSKIPVQGLSIADYMHGPISALTSKTQIFLVAQNDSDLSFIKDYIMQIRSRSPKIYWIGTNSLAVPGEIVIEGAKTGNEIHNCIIDCVIGQRFALEFARKNGLDPDKPTGLSKVTLTN